MLPRFFNLTSSPTKLTVPEEQNVLQWIFVSYPKMLDALIDFRIILSDQRAGAKGALMNYISQQFVPEIIKECEDLFNCRLSIEFSNALIETLRRAMTRKDFSNNVQKIIKGCFSKFLFPHLSYVRALSVFECEKDRLFELGKKIGVFCVDGQLVPDSRNTIFAAKWNELRQYLCNHYNRTDQPIGQSLRSTMLNTLGLLFVCYFGGFPYYGSILALSMGYFFFANSSDIYEVYKVYQYNALLDKGYVSPDALEMISMFDDLCKLTRLEQVKPEKAQTTLQELNLEFYEPEIASLTPEMPPIITPVNSESPCIPKEPKQKKVDRSISISAESGSASGVHINRRIDVSANVGYSAVYDPDSLTTSTMFPLRNSFLYILINPELQTEKGMQDNEWAKIYSLMQNTHLVRNSEREQGVKALGQLISDPMTTKRYPCYELKLLGTYGNDRLLGVMHAVESSDDQIMGSLQSETILIKDVAAGL
jgi:hypothetical protein